MIRHTPQSPPLRRPGAILLVVLALLALFAVIGLSFVLYAESEANSARVSREARRLPAEGLPPDPLPAAEAVLAQILYGDPANDRSALHGHDLATLKYGGQGGTAAYNGVGTVTGPLSGFPPSSGITMLNREDVINYARFGQGMNSEYIIDPEHVYGSGFPVRAFLAAAPNSLYDAANNPIAPQNAPGAIYVPKNANYTYPDRNNALVAMVNPTDGKAVASSGYRAGLFGGLEQTNPNWTLPDGKHKILRPRPIDHVKPGPLAPGELAMEFPYPPVNADGTVTGDVQNYRFTSGQQRNDSIWIYPGLPVTEYKGKKITALVAPMLLPLDGRLNLNVAGNVFSTANQHASHSGFGPHELALWRVLQGGQAAAQLIVQNRYSSAGPTQVPNPPELPSVATASALAGSGAYPTVPMPTQVFAIKPFQPTKPYPASGSYLRVEPSTEMNPGALGLSQATPPLAASVNWRGEPSQYYLPGDATNPLYNAAKAFASSPDFRQWDKNVNPPGSDSAFTPSTGGSAPAGDAVGHPLLWNPFRREAFSRGGPSQPGTFPINDLRYTAARYSVRSSDIQAQTYIGQPPGSYAYGAEFNVAVPNAMPNQTRARTTPISNSQQAAALGPNFFNTAARTLSLPPPMPGVPASLPALTATPTFSVMPGTTDGGSDTFDGSGSNQQLVSRVARLGPVDLNRPLTDYPVDPIPADPTMRTPTSGKLTAPAMADIARRRTAELERQALAYDIFVRLAVTSGGAMQFNTGTQRFEPSAAVGTPQYDALRWLAQYAANIVDATDDDDISTVFVWNVASANPLPTDRADPNYESKRSSAITTTPGNTTVFGVEKPRLVLNEIHAELANDERDASQLAANQPFQARFFAELLNPGVTDTATILPPNVPLAHNGGGQAAYRIQVYDNSGLVRSDLTGAASNANVTGRPTNALPLVSMPTAQNLAVAVQATDTNNQPVGVTGGAGSPPMFNAQSEYAVEPNDGAYQTAGQQRFGFALLGPGAAMGGPMAKIADNAASPTFVPDVTMAPFNLMIQKPLMPTGTQTTAGTPETNNMAYFVTTETDAGLSMMGTQAGTTAHDQLFKRHAVLLQRLANPYLPANDPLEMTPAYDATQPYNPWITIDTVYDVKLFDAVYKAKRTTTSPRGDRTTLPQKGAHGSIGRAQPYAGYMTASNPANPMANFPAMPAAAPDPYFTTMPTTYTNLATAGGNLTLRQNIADGTGGMTVHHSFMRHNGGSSFNTAMPTADLNLQYPFTWLPHFDRRLINQEELLHVAVCKPHEFTAKFAAPGTAPAPLPPLPSLASQAIANLHTLQRYFDPSMVGPDGQRGSDYRAQLSPATTGPHQSTLYRALEVLGVKPWVHDTPLGGRVAGKLNVNMIWDKAVFEALLDQNAGSHFTSAEVDQMWSDFTSTRTPDLTKVGDTQDENAAGTDRPFKSFGVPRFNAGTYQPSNSSVEDTLLRAVPAGTPTRLLFSTADAAPVAAPTMTWAHPYRRNEPLRKILNNVTTTTDTFLLIYTVSFFEVRNTTAGPIYPSAGGEPVILGKEVFKDVPGDLRQQFVAVLDRSNLTIPESPAAPAASPPTPFAPLTPSPAGGVWVLETQSDMVDVNPAGWTGSVQVNLISRPTSTTPVNGSELPCQPQVEGFYSTRDEDRVAADFTIAPASSPTQPGTRFAVGTGRQRLTLEATSGTWTYDPLTGRTRIPVAVVNTTTAGAEEPLDTATRTYPAGTMLTNVRFGAWFVQSPAGTYPVPKRDFSMPNPQVPLFGPLAPQ